MKKQTKIKRSSLPSRSPISTSLLFWLLLEHIHGPEWAYGVFWTLTVILVLAYVVSFFTEVERDVSGFGDRS